MSYIRSIELYQGFQGRFYIVDGFKYDIHFPIEWALTHLHGTGPRECDMCARVGTLRSVFVGYCSKCLTVYKIRSDVLNTISRGNYNSNTFNTFYDKKCTNESFWERYPYMIGIKLDFVGDYFLFHQNANQYSYQPIHRYENHHYVSDEEEEETTVTYIFEEDNFMEPLTMEDLV